MSYCKLVCCLRSMTAINFFMSIFLEEKKDTASDSQLIRRSNAQFHLKLFCKKSESN
jgi:hypothetical protein